MIGRFVCLLCDRCGSPSPLGDDAREARRVAEYQGWMRKRTGDGYVDLCPKCNGGAA